MQQFDDLCIISTYKRSEILFQQIMAFIDNMELFVTKGLRNHGTLCNSPLPETGYRFHRIKFVVVDDSDDSTFERKYRKEVTRIKKSLADRKMDFLVKVDYWDKKRQKKLIRKLGSFLNWPEQRFKIFFSDIDGKDYGGIRGICNICRIIGLYLGAKQDNIKPFLHFLDSDIFPMVLWRDKNLIKLSHLYYFFGHKDYLLENPKNRLLGSYYTVDSPSPIIDVYEALWFLEVFLTGAIKASWDSSKGWKDCIKNYDWIASKFSYDNIDKSVYFSKKGRELIDTPYISSSGNFKKQLNIVSKLIDVLFKGNNRMVLNTANYSKDSDWHGIRDYFSNGCVSMRYDVALTLLPYPSFGNQELILFPYEYAINGGNFIGDLDVAHIKQLAGRSDLFEDLKINQQYQLKHNFRQLFEIITELEKRGTKISNGIDNPRRRIKDDALKYAVYGSSIVKKIENKVPNIQRSLRIVTIRHPALIKIKYLVNLISKTMPQIKHQYVHYKSRKIISPYNRKLLDTWLNSFSDWREIVNVIRQLD